MNMFDKLGDKCLSCEKPYEKDNPEFVKNWYVMVNEKHDKQVRLYCPECWTKANEIIEDFKKRVEERIEKGNL